MQKSAIKLQLFVASLFLIEIIRSAPVVENDSGLEFIVLHNNDIHARFEETDAHSNKCRKDDAAQKKCYGGIARTAHEIRRFREEAKIPGGTPVIYLNAGDTYTGTVWFTIFKDKISSEMMNILAPEAMCLGNHEFDKGTKGLVPFLNNVKFPVVTANLGLDRSPKLKEAKNLKNSTILLVNQVKVGVIGYLTMDTLQMTSADDIDIYPEIEIINKEAAKLKEQGVNIIIALGHVGFVADKKVALNCPEVDLVIGGHTNTFLWTGEAPDIEEPEGPYPVVITQSSGKKVPVVQAYAYTKYLGNIKLKFDSNGDLIRWEGNPILLDSSIPQDSDVLEALEVYRPQISTIEDAVVGTTNVRLDGTRNGCRKGECNLGSLLSDSMVYARRQELKKLPSWKSSLRLNDAVIAFVQGGGIRSSIEKKTDGAVTSIDVLNVLPFNNSLYVISVPGSIIRTALERSGELYDKDHLNGGFLQMSGIKVTFDMSQPYGHRAVNILVRCVLCKRVRYDTLDDKKMYKIILTSFLLKGGDGHKWTNDTNPVENAEKLNITDYNAALDYIKAKSPINYQKKSRIILI